MDVSTSFRTNLRKLRLAARLTQEALAHDAKTTSSYLSEIETGKSSPSLKVMDRLANALGVSLTYLLADRLLISIVSDGELEVGALIARPAVRLARQPLKITGRPPKKH